MNASPSWLALFDVSLNGIWPLVLVKLTILLASAWLAHAALGGCNPRWRVLLWRAAACGIVLSTALTFAPPFWTVPLVPASDTRDRTSAADSIEHESSTAHLAPSSSMRTQQYVAERLDNHDAQVPSQHEACSTEISNLATPYSESFVQRPAEGGGWTLFLMYAPLVYSAGVLAYTAWAIIGLRRLRRLLDRTTPVSAPILAQATRAATALGLLRPFALRQTDDLSVPCVAGCRRPVVLLPERQCQPEYDNELPAILAHELAHLHGRDPFANTLLHVLSMALWFHPLMWRVRIAHTDACDGVADALAADYLQDANDYCRTLARLTLRVTAPETAGGLAMAHTASVRHRIAEVRRFVYRANLPPRRAALALAVALAGTIALGGLGVSTTQAERPHAVAPVIVNSSPGARPPLSPLARLFPIRDR